MDRNIFILFSPGTGGNHVANMLSTDTNLHKRTDKESYINLKKNAHFSKNKNLDFNSSELPINNTGNVLCGHWGEFYWLKLHNHLEYYINRQIFILEVPTKGSNAYKRYLNYQNLSEFHVEEQRSLYSIGIIQKCFDEHDLFVFPSDLIFEKNIQTFYDYTKYEMNLNLNINDCEFMHNHWIKKQLT